MSTTEPRKMIPSVRSAKELEQIADMVVESLLAVIREQRRIDLLNEEGRSAAESAVVRLETSFKKLFGLLWPKRTEKT